MSSTSAAGGSAWLTMAPLRWSSGRARRGCQLTHVCQTGLASNRKARSQSTSSSSHIDTSVPTPKTLIKIAERALEKPHPIAKDIPLF
eukprot:4197077-Amphidinium_carterae.1